MVDRGLFATFQNHSIPRDMAPYVWGRTMAFYSISTGVGPMRSFEGKAPSSVYYESATCVGMAILVLRGHEG